MRKLCCKYLPSYLPTFKNMVYLRNNIIPVVGWWVWDPPKTAKIFYLMLTCIVKSM